MKVDNFEKAMNWFEKLLYKLGWRWPSLAPKTTLDSYFNRLAKVRVPTRPKMGDQLLDNRTLQLLAGCPAGGAVEVEIMSDFTVRLSSVHRALIKNRNGNANAVEIRREPDGYILYLDYIWFADTCPSGLGPVALLWMARQAQQLGFIRLELLAAGGTGIKGSQWTERYWGFSTWPRFGFDTEIQPVMLQLMQLKPHLSNLRLVSEVIAIDLQWWKDHGDGWEMTFDLQEGSKSWETLYKYLSGKGLIS